MTHFKTKQVLPVGVMHGHGVDCKQSREEFVMLTMAEMLSQRLPIDVTNALCRRTHGLSAATSALSYGGLNARAKMPGWRILGVYSIDVN
jgi:hypothetical protein